MTDNIINLAAERAKRNPSPITVVELEVLTNEELEELTLILHKQFDTSDAS